MPNNRNSVRKLRHIHEFICFLTKGYFCQLRVSLICQFSDSFWASLDQNQKGQRFFSALSTVFANEYIEFIQRM